MKKFIIGIATFFTIVFILFGNQIGEKNASMSVIYAVTATLSLLLLISYCLFVKKKDKWFFLLYSCVLIVNLGYYMLSISKNISTALIANRISYFGSVFLPLSILMSILKISGVKYKKILPILLLSFSFVIFLITATPGIFSIYYKEVSLNTINGITVLNKVYGPLHCIYLYYLMFYFIAMISIIVSSTRKGKIKSLAHATILLFAVLVNLGVWFIEQIVKFDFEMLSISYIVTELFLIGVYLIIQEHEIFAFNFTQLLNAPQYTEEIEQPNYSQEIIDFFKAGISTLTESELNVYNAYLEGKTQKDIAKESGVKVGTVKFHTTHLYEKLGITSRKSLLEISKIINAE